MFPNLSAAGCPAANGTSTPPSFFSTPRQRSGFHRSFRSWEAYWVIEALKYVLKRIPSFTLTEILLFLGLRGLQGVGDVKDLKWEDLWALGMSRTSPDSILDRDLRNTSLLPQLPYSSQRNLGVPKALQRTGWAPLVLWLLSLPAQEKLLRGIKTLPFSFSPTIPAAGTGPHPSSWLAELAVFPWMLEVSARLLKQLFAVLTHQR